MNGWVYVWIAAAGLFGWALLLEQRIDFEHRLAVWWVTGSRGLGTGSRLWA